MRGKGTAMFKYSTFSIKSITRLTKNLIGDKEATVKAVNEDKQRTSVKNRGHSRQETCSYKERTIRIFAPITNIDYKEQY